MEISLFSIFSIAFLASLGHCIGMCGGIVLAYSSFLPQGNFFKHLFYHLAYHSGKMMSYAALGLIAGGLGGFLSLNMFVKNIVFLFIGVLLVFIGLGVAFLPRIKRIFEVNFSFFNALNSLFTRFLGQGSARAVFMLGVCNGLLPCGVVYFFLLSAGVAGGAWQGALTMVVFGIATMPSLLLLGMTSSSLQRWRSAFLKLSGVGMIAFGFYEIYKSTTALFGLF